MSVILRRCEATSFKGDPLAVCEEVCQSSVGDELHRAERTCHDGMVVFLQVSFGLSSLLENRFAEIKQRHERYQGTLCHRSR